MSDLLSYAENLGSGSINSAPLHTDSSLAPSSSTRLTQNPSLALSLNSSASTHVLTKQKQKLHQKRGYPVGISIANPNPTHITKTTSVNVQAEPRGVGQGEQVTTPLVRVKDQDRLKETEGVARLSVVAMAEQKKGVKYVNLPSPDLSKSIVPLKTPEEYAKSYKSKSSSLDKGKPNPNPTGRDRDGKPSPSRLFSSMGSKPAKPAASSNFNTHSANASVDKGKRAGSFKLGAAVQVDSSDDSADSTDDSDFQEQHTQRSKAAQGSRSSGSQSSWNAKPMAIAKSKPPPQQDLSTEQVEGQGSGYSGVEEEEAVKEAAQEMTTPADPTVCRYHCLECPDYDLCETCFREGTKDHDSNHAMERLSIEKAIQKINGSSTEGAGGASQADTTEATTAAAAGGSSAIASTTGPEKSGDEGVATSKTQQAKGGGKAEAVQKPRRRVRPVKAAAGAAMDMMNLTLQRCELGAARDGATSTRAAEQFNSCFEAGERVFKEYGLEFAAASPFGRIVALNAMVLGGIPPHTPKHLRARPLSKPVTHKEVEAIAACICDQFVVADGEEWFSTPVKRDEVPEYYERIDDPMDLSKIKLELRMYEFSVKPVYAPLALLEQRLRLIWKNARAFNGQGHPVHKRAVALESATTRVMIQTKVALGFQDIDLTAIEIPISLKTIDEPVQDEDNVEMEDLAEIEEAEDEEEERAPKPQGRKRKRGNNATSTGSMTVTVGGSTSTASKETMTTQVHSPLNSSSREAALVAQVATLKSELKRANERMDALYKIMKGGFAKLSEEVGSLR